MAWIPFKGNTSDILIILGCQLPGEKRDHEGVLVAEILYHVDDTYESSGRTKLGETHELRYLHR